MPDHHNTRYEYTTRERPYPEAVSTSSDAEMEQEGWTRVWSDVCLEGVFVVYRRTRPEFRRQG